MVNSPPKVDESKGTKNPRSRSTYYHVATLLNMKDPIVLFIEGFFSSELEKSSRGKSFVRCNGERFTQLGNGLVSNSIHNYRIVLFIRSVKWTRTLNASRKMPQKPSPQDKGNDTSQTLSRMKREI